MSVLELVFLLLFMWIAISHVDTKYTVLPIAVFLNYLIYILAVNAQIGRWEVDYLIPVALDLVCFLLAGILAIEKRTKQLFQFLFLAMILFNIGIVVEFYLWDSTWLWASKISVFAVLNSIVAFLLFELPWVDNFHRSLPECGKVKTPPINFLKHQSI